MIFKYDQYATFLQEMKKLAEPMLFKDWSGEKTFLIRHDIDLNLDLAFRLAQVEHQENVVSTYFVLLTCDTYNALSAANVAILKNMIEMGFEIGLHFDPSIYKPEEISQSFKFEVGILENTLQQEIKSVSLHNPSIHNQYPMFEGFLNAYDPKIFSDDKYLSDSRMQFRNKNPFEFIKNVKEHVMQILTHPMHFSEDGMGYFQIIPNALNDYMKRMDYYFRHEFKSETYVSTFKDELDKELLINPRLE